MKWIMLVSGVLTCTMIYAAIDPHAALLSTFGESLEGPVAEIVVRNWGVLITLVGGLLIYGAFAPAARPAILGVAGLSKAGFVILVLINGREFLDHQAGVAIVIDSIWVILYTGYLVRFRRGSSAA